ncbi:dihydroorotase, partial [Fischerella thermalis WC213]
MTSELLQQVRIIDPVSGTDQVADVLIEDGYIQSVNNNISDVPQDTYIQDCSGLVLGTGLIDLYSHSGEPGFEERETLCSLLKAAAAGGFTRISILPDTSPVVDNPAVVAQFWEKMREQGGKKGHGGRGSNFSPLSPPHLNIWGAITFDVAGKQMTEFADLAVAGVVGFADGQPLENTALVR